MKRPIIICDRLSKQYRLGANRHKGIASGMPPSLRDAISAKLRSARDYLGGTRREDGPDNAGFWALKDVSFEVGQGEVVGIIGRNGAGKSTLLKILSRIVEPTAGTARLRGRLASLLEVGTGFHPELTGRENIYLNGVILGMRKAEIDRKFDEIVAFSEIEKFLDTPVKRYSSGMYIRLAFAVAAHLEPEVLIVDEVLSVGDFAFQKKCLGKMHDVAAGDGRTVLFVSHHMGALTQLCDRGVLLEKGSVKAIGPIADVVRQYLRTGLVLDQARVDFPLEPDKPCQYVSAEVLHSDGSPGSEFECDEPITLRLRFEVREYDSGRSLSLTVQNIEGTPIVFSDFRDGNLAIAERMHPGLHTFEIRIPPRILAPTTYQLNLYCTNEYARVRIEERLACCEFTLRDLANIRQIRRAVLGIQLPWDHHHQEHPIGAEGGLTATP
jgi:lipopolysaccharide transport system ATP-binding protein